MASAGKPNIDDGRRGTSSPKLKGRGCVFNHDPSRVNDAQHPESRSSSKEAL
ncbi:hypothetical protein CISG_00543 [Coccidioides immitis RMSCC 3703]|uniref:Uncharacterized protein n=1 Tax=Coccidioides immitis RMSCC 3703 TaxID=454286 RepID=A0A0J8QIP9_COCIT|nr:hypothetical protein CISG_00543 [Coccidioides immitis RMSCC 3703]